MRISKIAITNFKCFEERFEVELDDGVNILAGDNEAGKSTILQAIHIGLTGTIESRHFKERINPSLFNNKAVRRYTESLTTNTPLAPPAISIELYFDGAEPELTMLRGNENAPREDSAGVAFRIEFDDDYLAEYEAFLTDAQQEPGFPIEYYKATWRSFARESVTRRRIPLKSVFIDPSSSSHRHFSSHMSRTILSGLDDQDRVRISRAFRNMNQSFSGDETVKALNVKLRDIARVSDLKRVTIQPESPSKDSWETSLLAYLDNVPFHQIGRGEQSIVQARIALSQKRAREANVVLVEEPESHLSHTTLNRLLSHFESEATNADGSPRQVIISTHSSFVANKLGLGNLHLLNNRKVARLRDLTPDTQKFFKKLPGYKTLRLLLCKRAILVEGDADELIFQRAYMDQNHGRLPVHDGIDVISVGMSFLRFLEIAAKIDQPVAVVTDNDGNHKKNIELKYKDYETSPNVRIFASTDNALNTLEPQFLTANLTNLMSVSQELRQAQKSNPRPSYEKLLAFMLNNKAEWALRIFDSPKRFSYPDYMTEAVAWCAG